MSTDLNALSEAVLGIARDAGEAILAIYNTEDFNVEMKADDSPLTAADRAAHEVIVAGLEKLTPEIPVLSEESAAIPFGQRSQWNTYWLVDPLDGTKEFIKRNGEFTVNIALISNHVPVLGVVHVPVKGHDYVGFEGGGAFRETAEGREAIKVTGEAQSPLRVVGSRSHRGESLDRYLENVGEYEMVPMGSSLKICLVAAGEADIYPRLGPTSEWDTGAAHAVVLWAGGQVIDVEGNPLTYNAKEDILNPYFIVYGDASRDWLSYL